MEFHIRVPGALSDIGVIENAVRTVDASALVDIDPARPAVRIAASVDLDQLVSVLRQAGYPVTRDDVTQLPSTCCGGCSG